MNTKSIAFVLLSLFMMYVAIQRTVPKGRVAKSGETNIYNSYENISGMKHDLFKLFWMTLIAGLLSPGNVTLIDFNDFTRSLLFRALVVGLSISFYHSTLQPLVNMLPAF